MCSLHSMKGRTSLKQSLLFSVFFARGDPHLYADACYPTKP